MRLLGIGFTVLSPWIVSWAMNHWYAFVGVLAFGVYAMMCLLREEEW